MSSGRSREGAWGVHPLSLILGKKRRNHRKKKSWQGKENSPPSLA